MTAVPEKADPDREPGLSPGLYERHAQAWTRRRGRTVSEGEGAWLDRFTDVWRGARRSSTSAPATAGRSALN